jgi:hypothetical protein
MVPSDIISIPDFIKMGQLAHKLNGKHRYHDLVKGKHTKIGHNRHLQHVFQIHYSISYRSR